MSRFPSVVIVSPALAEANNGNWRTALRWQEMLAGTYAARIVREWPDTQAGADTLMLALHARRSAPAVRAWAEAHPGRGLAVVLTGTDLYADLAGSEEARDSVRLAQRLVVLQDRGVQALAPALRPRARIIYQSTPARPALPRDAHRLQAVMVGHLRAAKAPQVLWAAARRLRGRADIRIVHVGDGSGDAALMAQARQAQRDCPAYAWLGALPHEEALRCIQQAHVLVHTSAMEGGAHVIMEAVRCGTPVLASRVDGNVGMLGEDYAGYFPPGDAAALADLLLQCRAGQDANDPAAGLLARLAAQCALRAPLFDAGAERRALLNLVQELEAPP